MSYPPAPWVLRGRAIQTVHLIDIDSIRSQIPSQLDIVSVFPGKTVGGIYVADYGASSTLRYSELIVVPALVRTGTQIGAWISHIYVDHPDSIAGGREIWGLPKENAQFLWQSNASQFSVEVRQEERSLCTLSRQWYFPGWQQSFSVPVLSLLNQQLLQFNGQADFKFYLTGVDLNISSSSPFAQLELGSAWFNFYFDPLQLIAKAPKKLP